MANEEIRKSYDGGTVPTSLNGAVASGDPTFTVNDGSTYPTGAVNPFVVRLSEGTAAEEKVLCTRAANVFTAIERGYDGTTAANHADGNTVTHCIDAHTIDQANKLANIITTRGGIPVRGATDWQGLILGTNNQILGSDGTDIEWRDDYGNNPWVPFTPNWINLTLGAGTETCTLKYLSATELRIRFEVLFAVDTVISGYLKLQLPNSETSDIDAISIGQKFLIVDASLGSAWRTPSNDATPYVAAASTEIEFVDSAGAPGGVDSSNPIIWTTNDRFAGDITVAI